MRTLQEYAEMIASLNHEEISIFNDTFHIKGLKLVDGRKSFTENKLTSLAPHAQTILLELTHDWIWWDIKDLESLAHFLRLKNIYLLRLKIEETWEAL